MRDGSRVHNNSPAPITRGAIAEEWPEIPVPVRSLVLGPCLRLTGTNSEHVQMLADLSDLGSLPPILVQRCGMRVIDGMHRLEAAKLRRSECIQARLIDCSDDEALVLAIKSNTLHGLPLTRPDRVLGAKRVLAAHPDWSDRAIAEVAGLSARTVAVLRNRDTDEVEQVSKRLGRDGKRRPVAGGEARRRAAEYLGIHPDASLRQVARDAGVSIGTAHDVREQIRRGTAPAFSRQSPAWGRESSEAPDDDQAGRLRPVSGQGAAVRRLTSSPRRTSQSATWPRISAKLAGDPALRYTEGGRAFLRWMSSRAMQPMEWADFVDAVPVHWLKDMSVIADSLSAEWAMFAERLRGRHDTAILPAVVAIQPGRAIARLLALPIECDKDLSTFLPG